MCQGEKAFQRWTGLTKAFGQMIKHLRIDMGSISFQHKQNLVITLSGTSSYRCHWHRHHYPGRTASCKECQML